MQFFSVTLSTSKCNFIIYLKSKTFWFCYRRKNRLFWPKFLTFFECISHWLDFFCLQVPVSLLITFSACTVLLIAVHMLALMISTCILPNVEAVANLHFQTSKTVFESPHMKMNAIVELAWGFSTVLGKAVYIRLTKMVCLVKSQS